MDKLNKISKTFLFLFAVTGIIWLGSYITRLSLFYQLFQSGELVLKNFVTDQNLDGILIILITAVSINMIFYVSMIITFIIFLILSKISLKLNGWLFISTLLIFLTFPFELYLMHIDYEIVMTVWKNSFDSKEVLKLVVERFTILSSFPIVEILSYIAIIYLFLFQPLKAIKRKLVE